MAAANGRKRGATVATVVTPNAARRYRAVRVPRTRRAPMPRSHFAAVLTLAAVFCPAQDMIAVDWTGGVYALDSMTGAATPIGVGFFGQNSLCRDAGGVLWTSGVQGPLPYDFVARLDPAAL